MRRFAAAAVAAVMVFSVSACGGHNDVASEPEPSASVSERVSVPQPERKPVDAYSAWKADNMSLPVCMYGDSDVVPLNGMCRFFGDVDAEGGDFTDVSYVQAADGMVVSAWDYRDGAWVERADVEPEPTVADLAAAVISGEYGNGMEREALLGERFGEVQELVDSMLAPAPVESFAPVAQSTAVDAPVVQPVQPSAAPVQPVVPAPVASVSSAMSEAEWNWWVSEFGGYEEYQGVAWPAYADIPQCQVEDGATADGYQSVCYWDGAAVGNGVGASYVLVDGAVIFSSEL
ncbi:hypothetical protein [Bifidobacterium oedipodis]|uniref:Cpl-7 lysozyme C-terminal domain-containing protein n=1 Tax=Bifidobacterium oedipodis TaxID=2675322 RepID=A0A7Y0HSD2_9BIFI|nr:hypothetical protein [Bifidobacterium sp. DSM 109957]NMM93886.1 hypothetical protein [Bifidobacterium sp. DSM 109957]